MTETEDMKLCEDLLHRHGLKNTRTRREVLRLLRQCGGVLTAEDISRALVEEGKKPDFSTLYRILELFTNADWRRSTTCRTCGNTASP